MTRPATPPVAPRRFDERWRLSRAGIVNVWHYLDNEFDLSGGRMILRGTNGSGKSRALEMLLPFLLDADRRKMDATGASRVNLDELMRTGAREQANRTGYLWLELARPGQYLTIGALVRHSQSASSTKVWYFTTPLRVGDDLALLSDAREPLSRDALIELIGAERVTESAAAHRDRVRVEVFGLDGDTGRDRYDGLLQLLHTLRAPDVGNRIDEGRLPQILIDSLPPLHEQALTRAGEQLDGLTETRAAQERLEQSSARVASFLSVYQRYAATVLRTTAQDTLAAADAVVAAERAATDRAQELATLEQQYGQLQSREHELIEELAELDHALRAIEASEIFKTADDLVQRDRAVAALARSAEQALGGAERERANHRRAVDDAEQALGDVRRAVTDTATLLASAREAALLARLPVGRLPEQMRAVDRAQVVESAVLRVSRDGEARAVLRPSASLIDIVPLDLDEAGLAADSVRTGALDRQTLAARRLAEAARLARAEAAIERLAADADRLAAAAESNALTAGERATERDTVAVELAHAWQTWTDDPATIELLGAPDWTTDPLIDPVLLDGDALAGEQTGSLGELDEVAELAARPARAAVDAERARLDLDAGVDLADETRLRSERAELVAERDPHPFEPPWLNQDRPGEPLWRCIDFETDVSDGERAGLEGALLAAGLLTATISSDASIRASDGELLIDAAGERAARPLSAVLRPDPAAALPDSTIAAVLERIGVDDPAAATSVSTDGSWRNGPLHGRHLVDRARHIGAAARAAHRQERITAIEADLAVLAERAEQREARRSELTETDRRLGALVHAAPRSSALYAARRLAAEASTRAERSAAEAARAATQARTARTSWVAEVEAHRSVCAHHDLPVEAEALQRAVDAARHAVERSAQLVRDLSRLAEAVSRHDVRVARTETAAGVRDEAELDAEDRWMEWHAAASELAAQHQALDLSIDQAREELDRTRRARDTTAAQHRAALKAVAAVGPQLGGARKAGEAASALVLVKVEQLVAAAQRFTRRISLPGLAAAATTELLPGIVHPENIDDVRSGASAIMAAVAEPRPPAAASRVFDAFREFDREVSGQLDARHWLEDDVHLVEVAGAGDEHTLAGAARLLASRVELGRAALSEREREVFTRFVLGGVAEELRRRMNQAGHLIAAMNTSLRGITTTNGIGVRLGWGLRDEHTALGRVIELVATSDAVRSEAQNAELTELLRHRVELHYASDPSSGYANHLAAALDYRTWHEVSVTILGPDPDQQRRLSRRAKLSQGETRFVSYVTLFAAADGYLTSLGDDGRALRFILLDDAFAKVDDTTVAELMGLLVALDLDFVMTGHALWGCFPQVPALDIYEVRRSNGSSAVTTHVHWDGRNRHLRSTA